MADEKGNKKTTESIVKSFDTSILQDLVRFNESPVYSLYKTYCDNFMLGVANYVLSEDNVDLRQIARMRGEWDTLRILNRILGLAKSELARRQAASEKNSPERKGT